MNHKSEKFNIQYSNLSNNQAAVGSPPIDVVTGPVLRYLGQREGTRFWRGSVLIVTKDATSVVNPAPVLSLVQIPLNPDLQQTVAPLEGNIPAFLVYQEYGYTFWRFDLELTLAPFPQILKYSINVNARASEFILPADSETMNVVFHSCNGFSLSVNPDDFQGCLWKDVVRHHYKKPYHAMLGGGDQIYCDSVKEFCPPVMRWCESSHHTKHSLPFGREDREETERFILELYISWYGFGYWKGPKGACLKPDFPHALSVIPSVNIFDDHDLIDGFGSYREKTMLSPVFNGIGNIGFKYYMLFQHQTSPAEAIETEPSWVSPLRPGPYIRERSRSVFTRLGRSMAFFGLDCRTERTMDQVVTPEAYDMMFQRIASEVQQSNGEIQHVLIMLGVPIAYPRLVWLENLLTSSVMAPVTALAKRGVIGGTLNDFDGAIEILDDLNDHWCAKGHKTERNQFVNRMQKLAMNSRVRVTILGGDVHLAAIGRLRAKDTKVPPGKDHRLMLNIISSAITNTPPPDKMADFLNKRNKVHHFDHSTDEDMVRIFKCDVDGSARNNRCLLPRRNWCSISQITPSFNAVPSGNVNENELSEDNLTFSGNGTGRQAGPRFSRFKESAAPSNKQSKVNASSDQKEPAYSDAAGGLSIVLHMEKDQKNVDSATRPYEVLVPLPEY